MLKMCLKSLENKYTFIFKCTSLGIGRIYNIQAQLCFGITLLCSVVQSRTRVRLLPFLFGCHHSWRNTLCCSSQRNGLVLLHPGISRAFLVSITVQGMINVG